MLVLLDTNVLVSARAAAHPYHAIFTAWMRGEFDLVLSTEILLEYAEVLTALAGPDRWQLLERLIEISPHTKNVGPTFRFQIIAADQDDNKFSDAAIVAGADYIVTDDAHFAALIGSGYRVLPIKPLDFIREKLAKS